MELNNRVFVFQLRGRQAADVLLVFGCAGPATIDAVKEIEKPTGAPVTWVVSNGGAHHLFLDLWYTAFPTARVLIPAKRIPSTRNGKALAEKYAARWQLMTGPKPAQLVEEFGDEIDVVIFDQLFQASDETSTTIANTATDHKSAPTHLGGFMAGHKFQMMYAPKGHTTAPKFKMSVGGFPMNLLMKMMMPADPKIHIAEWEAVLAWDIKAWTGAHNAPTGARLKWNIKHKKAA